MSQPDNKLKDTIRQCLTCGPLCSLEERLSDQIEDLLRQRFQMPMIRASDSEALMLNDLLNSVVGDSNLSKRLERLSQSTDSV